MLDINELIFAYTKGYFPMADPDEDNTIYWYKPEQRGVIPLDKFHVSKNLKRLNRNKYFELRMNTAFEEVVRACAERSETWISEEIIEAYCKLNTLGYAMSVESWKDGKLVGGLYGVVIGRAFCGESMFHRATDASKIALIHLVDFLKANDFVLLDTQYLNDHLLQFGAVEISDKDYMEQLNAALI